VPYVRNAAWRGRYLPFGQGEMIVAPFKLHNGSPGLGVLYKQASDGTVIDCDLWSNIFQGPCWDPTAPTVVPVAPSGGDSGSGDQAPAVPAVPAPTGGACSQSFVSGICNSYVLIGGAAILAGLFFFGGRR
jgi:hypothetical protein